ncbi:hypothetical protein BG261_04245 [Floricoccus tropicus]|uniref:Glycosyltransferase 2-like domain-containing protein n=1 Tax=Floricoccus tropicus TaxID=1859473 RepID=A0A1E8GLI2_9LACT|nr:hypothetical protein [Floricoccus tropicus]OFI49090.1 hypothetical protein BG261_04245 [Floricoccus tropicus]
MKQIHLQNERDIMILATIINDPHKKLLDDIELFSQKLNDIFSEIYLCISDFTDLSVIHLCEEMFFNTKVIERKGAAHARRSVLNFVAELDSSEDIMYCDFDRVLTWIKMFPEELEVITNKKLNSDYVVLGRTKEAFESHPESWQATEAITNKISSKYFGINDLDITAGASIMSAYAASMIAHKSSHSHTDCEWPYLVKKAGYLIGSKKVNGLLYMDINSVNFPEEEAKEYFSRLELSQKILSVLFK